MFWRSSFSSQRLQDYLCRSVLLPLVSLQVRRCLSSELNAALRPFYFAVHPDLFAQHPKQQNVNETSLKQLSAHMEILYERRYQNIQDTKVLKFYIRDSQSAARDIFKLIKITLTPGRRDPKSIILELLELCSLSTDYIKSLKPSHGSGYASTRSSSAVYNDFSKYQKGGDFNYGADFNNFDHAFQQKRETVKNTLEQWLKTNVAIARKRTAETADLKEDVTKLQNRLVQRLGLRELRYDCGWNYEHFRGCLKTLERMATMHETHMQVLKDRIVVFAAFTGVSLEGHIMFYTGDVMTNWLEFVRDIPKQDEFLTKIPNYENTLSQVLRNIKIRRRKFMPKQQAVNYAKHLTKVTTTLNDYLSMSKYPKSWPESLHAYGIVIESEAGPLMVNPTGQFITPATCPGFLLVDFISTNLDVAKERIEKYKHEKYVEKELLQVCIKHFNVQSLTKDDSVTPDKMIKALTQLLKLKSSAFENLNLHITTYFSVLSDGIVCIPWDFETR